MQRTDVFFQDFNLYQRDAMLLKFNKLSFLIERKKCHVSRATLYIMLFRSALQCVPLFHTFHWKPKTLDCNSDWRTKMKSHPILHSCWNSQRIMGCFLGRLLAATMVIASIAWYIRTKKRRTINMMEKTLASYYLTCLLPWLKGS
jgi:hypothetical protein